MAQVEIQQTHRPRVPVPLKIPSPTREAWGELATDAFTDWMEVAVLPYIVPRDEYREILSRMDVLESRMGGLGNRMDDRIDGLGNRMDDRIDGLGNQMDGRIDDLGNRMDSLEHAVAQNRVEFKAELHEHWRETRIAIGELRQEIRENAQTTHAQLNAMTDRLLIQTRWMVGSLTVIGTLVTLLLTVGMFVK
ncbi:MAG: hypothetical protein U9R15_19000 [Chloroflexota bacterium]|nr:hypothetical protein [Chloroflexota bacterium]